MHIVHLFLICVLGASLLHGFGTITIGQQQLEALVIAMLAYICGWLVTFASRMTSVDIEVEVRKLGKK